MHIAFVIASLSAGGAEGQAALLCTNWAARGHVVSLITFDNAPDHYAVPDTVGRLRLRAGNRTRKKLALAINDIRALRRTFSGLKPDVIVSFLDTINFKTLVAAKALAIPVVISERTVPAKNDATRSPAGRRLFQKTRQFLYPSAAVLVVQTQAVAAWAKTMKLAKDVRVIPNTLQPCGIAIDMPRKNTILAIGRMSSEKGHDLLIDAFAAVARKNKDWQLRILGDGPNRAELAALAAMHGMADRIEMPGICKSIAQEYRTAGIFVLPSRFEGFPNVLLEAMRGGCAVISSNCDAMEEIVTPGKDGLLFASGRVDGLADKLRLLIADNDLRARLQAAAPATAARYYPDVTMPLWEAALSAAIQSRS